MNRKLERKNRERKNRKQILLTTAMAVIIFVLLGAIIGFLVSSKFAERVNRFLSDLNPFKSEEKTKGGEGDLGTAGSLTEKENQSVSGTSSGGGGGGGTSATEEVEYGSGKLEIINWVNSNDYTRRPYHIVHYSGGSEGTDGMDGRYYTIYTKETKITSNVSGYELYTDVRPVNSLTEINLQLSLASKSGSSMTLSGVTNELHLSLPLEASGYDFSGKTITIQQYDPNNPSASYTAYNVKNVIEDNNGVITLARLDGTYDSEVPYAYFRLGFS